MKILLLNILFSFSTLLYSQSKTELVRKDSSELEKVFVLLQLQNVQTLDSTIKVDLKYASTHNFMKMNMYGNLDQAYLQKDVAKNWLKLKNC